MTSGNSYVVNKSAEKSVHDGVSADGALYVRCNEHLFLLTAPSLQLISRRTKTNWIL